MTRFGSSMDDFEEAFGAELGQLLTARGVAVEVIRTGGLELNPADPLARAAESGAATILAIGQTESQRVISGPATNTRKYTFDASLLDVSAQRRVWRAEVKSSLDSYSSAGSGGRTMAQRVFGKLDEDGLLPRTTSAEASGTGQ